MDAAKLAAGEAALKTRLANKVALECEDRGLDASALAARLGSDPEVAAKILDGDVAELPLFALFAALTSIGLNVRFSTAKAASDRGQILYDLDDAA